MHNQEAFPGSNTAAAILVAAGSATRMAGKGLPPKQFRLLGGKPMLLWSIEALVRCSRIRDIVLVVSPESVKLGYEFIAESRDPRFIGVSIAEGGATRTDSVRSGLATIRFLNSHPSRPLPGKILIHDAARPGLTVEVVEELLKALDHADAAAPALPVTDALKNTQDGVRAVDREGLVRVQTPQAFRWSVIAEAYASADVAVDDLALVEATGARVVLTRGRQELMKITHPEDMAIAERLIATPAIRIGNGFDVHGFAPGDGVTICGVRIPHTKKLEGHSDADVGWHALTDAILGAAALGDIGDHFPPSDPRWKGADSRLFLHHAARLAADRGLRVVNADVTILCEKPRIAPHREAMRMKTAETLGLPIDAVSVKATTTEKLGFLGREEGIAAQAVVLLAG